MSVGVKKNLEGMRFGKLTILYEHPDMKYGCYTWVCQCDCGKKTHPIPTNMLLSGNTRSCGCYRAEVTRARSVTHDSSNTRLYGIWRSMKSRCLNQRAEKYKTYGGRGIKVCEEWLNDFQAFYDWAMANGYQDDLTIDRIDVNGDYCPENCRWVDMRIQSNNRRTNVLVEINGERKTFGEWSNITGIRYATIYQRYLRGDRGESLIREVKA